LTGSSEIALSVHAQYKFGQNTNVTDYRNIPCGTAEFVGWYIMAI